jgi:hypothetical protein
MNMTIQTDLGSEVRSAAAGLARPSGEQTLLNLALDAVQTVDEARLSAAAPATAPFRPQMLLTLLSYCYARGQYDSRDIATSISGDQTLRYICSGGRPGWRELRRFRREHRDLVAQCLAWVFKQAWALKLDEGEASFRGYEWFENDLAQLIERETATRLGVAALLDSTDSE